MTRKNIQKFFINFCSIYLSLANRSNWKMTSLGVQQYQEVDALQKVRRWKTALAPVLSKYFFSVTINAPSYFNQLNDFSSQKFSVKIFPKFNFTI